MSQEQMTAEEYRAHLAGQTEPAKKTGPDAALSSPRAESRPAIWQAVDEGSDHISAVRLSTGERALITRAELADEPAPITGRLTIHDAA